MNADFIGYFIYGDVCTHRHTFGGWHCFQDKSGFYNSCFNGLLIFRLQLTGNRKSSISLTQREAATWTRPRWWSQRMVKLLVFQEGCSRLECFIFSLNFSLYFFVLSPQSILCFYLTFHGMMFVTCCYIIDHPETSCFQATNVYGFCESGKQDSKVFKCLWLNCALVKLPIF